MHAKRIGIDCRLWNETGVGRYIRNLVQELSRLDKETHYILFFRKDEYETVPLPGKNFEKVLANIKWHSIEEQTALPAILEKEHLDLMHFPYFSYPILYKKKFVITIHDLILNHFPTGKASTLPTPLYWLKHFSYRFALSQAIGHAANIIAVSKTTKQEILEHYQIQPEKIAVTYEGIDETISPEHMEKVEVQKPYFFYVGNAYPHKNLERLIDAFSLFLKETKGDARLILVGREDYFYRQLEEKVIKEQLQENILFYRHISDGQLSFLYHHALGVVLPSLMEGFGLPALEAMENNCLVLASEIPAFIEVCGGVPAYFDPFNIHAIADTLKKAYLHQIDGVEQKKREGIKRAKDFSWKTMARETLDVYKSILE